MNMRPGHRLFVAMPSDTHSKTGWPILPLLDGNAAFDFLTPDLLALAPDSMAGRAALKPAGSLQLALPFAAA